MRYDSAELRYRPRRRELENRCRPTRGGSGARPTAIAIVYCFTESIPGTATHRQVLLAAAPSGRQQISATGQEGHQP